MTGLRRLPPAGVTIAMLLASFALAPAATAHEGITAGPYVLDVGWQQEPPSIGQPNGIQVKVTSQADGEPVVDIEPGDLGVAVSTAGQDGSRLSLVPAFGAGTAGRPRGTYEAAFFPKAAGTYTFHITGSIHGTPVDLSVQGVVAEGEGAASPGPHPLLLIGGAVLLLLLVGIGYLLLRVRPAPAEPSESGPDGLQGRVPSKRKPRNRPPAGRPGG